MKDLWWLARNGVTYRSPMSLQAVELTTKKNPQGDYQICHVKDDGDNADCWHSLSSPPPSRVVESRGNTTIFRAPAPATAPKKPIAATQDQRPNFETVPAQKNVPEKIDDMCKVIQQLEAKVDRLLDANELIKNLEHREKYLREAEELVHQKAQNLEHERTELDQLRDELEKRRFRLGSA
ncbi:hypothetical protein GCM10007047_33360 [Cerasicoccus arenae]|uniref:Uncharacterized protein n=2 Tax=Cerasicoccus arenae TaxID=424488 RepID=A0A8J3DK46_9BACT|nr:hypothetical protein GCM10007047_33360 [Cerasicoccus arenae]